MGRVEKYDDIPVFQGHERERGPTKMISRKALKEMQRTKETSAIVCVDVCRKMKTWELSVRQ